MTTQQSPPLNTESTVLDRDSQPMPMRSELLKWIQNSKLLGPRYLRTVEVQRGADGVTARSGRSATAVKATKIDGSEVALCVFDDVRPDRQKSYEALHQLLKNKRIDSPHDPNDSFPEILRFAFHDQGIRNPETGLYYPVLEMEWAPGRSLYQWCKACVEEKTFDSLRVSAENFRSFVQKMQNARLVHGDFHHDNLFVSDDCEVYTIDYDTLCQVADPPKANRALGHPSYQQACRNSSTLVTESLDNFSALLIYLAMLAIAEEPSLWTQFVVARDNDGLLFTVDDLAEPKRSPLFATLEKSPNPLIRKLAETVIRFYEGPVRSTPTIEQVAEDVANEASLNKALQEDNDELFVELSKVAKLKRAIDRNPGHKRLRLAREREDLTRRMIALACQVVAGEENAFDEFHDTYDRRILAKFPALVESEFAVLETATRASIAPRILSELPTLQVSMIAERNGQYSMKWPWPDSRFVAECMIGLTEQEPKERDFPYQFDLTARELDAPTKTFPVEVAHLLTRESYENLISSDSYRCPAFSQNEYRNWWVVIWFFVDLCGKRIPVAPISLGQIR